MAWWSDIVPWGTRERLATTVELMSVGPVAPQRSSVPVPPPQRVEDEYGVAGTENFGGYIRQEDFNPELDDFQRAVRIYDKMRRTDSNIRAMLQVMKLPLRGATWECQPPVGGDPVDKQISDFCTNALFDDDAMTSSWDATLRHILLQLDFGFSVLEKVWRVDDDGFFKLKRLAPRLPKTIREWHTNRDGSLRAIVQYAPVAKAAEREASGQQRTITYQTSVSYQYLTIPAAVAVVFSFEKEGDNFEGWSILRTVYRNWWYKDQAYHIEGVSLDRFGVGIPVAELEEGHNLTTTQNEALRDTLKRIRSNERAYLVSPPHVKFKLLPEGQAGSGGARSMAWIDHHDSAMARNVLAGFLTMGRDTKGTLGFGSRLTDMFISSLNGVAKGIAADLKQQVIKDLCDLNFDMTRRQYPSVVVRDLEDVDMENIVNTMAQLTGTVLTPTDDDEAQLRKIMGLPPLDPKYSRERQMEKAAAAPGGEGGAPLLGPDGKPVQQDPNNPGQPLLGPDGQPVPKALPPGEEEGAEPKPGTPHVKVEVGGQELAADDEETVLRIDLGNPNRGEGGKFGTSADGPGFSSPAEAKKAATEGAKVRREGKAQKVKKVEDVGDKTNVTYGDDETAMFKKGTTDLTPSVRNDKFVGWQVKGNPAGGGPRPDWMKNLNDDTEA